MVLRTRPDVKPIVFWLDGKDCEALLANVGPVGVDVSLVAIRAQPSETGLPRTLVRLEFGLTWISMPWYGVRSTQYTPAPHNPIYPARPIQKLSP